MEGFQQEEESCWALGLSEDMWGVVPAKVGMLGLLVLHLVTGEAEDADQTLSSS